jgi:hypothetical protein
MFEEHEKVLAPTIINNHIVATMACEIIPDKCIEVGDHTVVVARVVDAFTAADESWNLEGSHKAALIYFNGDFGGAKRIAQMPNRKSSSSDDVLSEQSTTKPPKRSYISKPVIIKKSIVRSSRGLSRTGDPVTVRLVQNEPTEPKEHIELVDDGTGPQEVDLFPTFDLEDTHVTIRHEKKKR